MPVAIRIDVGLKQIRHVLNAPLTDRRMMRRLGAQQATAIQDRTFNRGKRLDGQPLGPYSTRGPYYVTPGKGTGARLAPKGGEKTKKGSIRYAGGYAEYKASSRGVHFPDFVLSGRTMGALKVLRSSKRKATVGFSGREAQEIAAKLQQRDEFFGVSDEDLDDLQELAVAEVQRIIDARIKRGGKR